MAIFKAYDIRGIVPDELDEEKARRIGYHFATHVGGKRYVVGRDMRSTSEAICEAVIDGINHAGADVVKIGMSPTPMTYFAIGHLGADGGISVTASHNPPRYNGFKICREQAIPIGLKTGLKEIEEDYESHPELPAESSPRGSVTDHDILDEYLEHVMGFAQVERKIRVVVDGGNGIAALTVERIMDLLPSVEMVPLFMEIDGSFPNHEANPMKDENILDLRQAVIHHDADLGIAFDGDADRVAFVNEEGNRVSSDLITALIAREILSKNPDTPIIYDLRSSWVVPEEIRAYRGFPIRERVGHAFIRATMREKEAIFGGELSGHYYFRDNYYSDCADLAMLMILNLMSRSGKKLSALVRPLNRYYATGEINFVVDDKEGKVLEVAKEFAGARIDYLDGITVSYPNWWFNVRPSNTEPLLRLNMEAKTLDTLVSGRARVIELLGTPLS